MLGHGAIGVIEQIDGDVEFAIRLRALGAGQALEHDLDRRAALQAGELRLDVGEHADLRRRAGRAAKLVEMVQQRGEFSTVSIAGLRPISASPAPSDRPQ